MSDDLERKLASWADQVSPVTADEARARAEAGGLGTLEPAGSGAAGGGATGSRRLLAAAAAVVLVGAVAIGGWVMANDGDDDPTGVDTVDQPTTSMANDSTPSVAPTTSTEPTTVPAVTASEAPDLIVVHSAEHRLEVFDRTTGETVRVLAEFDDPEVKGPNGEPAMMGRYLRSVVVSPDGQTVFYGTSYLSGGEVFRIPITGGGDELDLVTFGADPAVSPDGSKLAVINTTPAEGDNGVMNAPALKVVDLTDGSVREVPIEGNWSRLASPSWSPDGSMLVLEGFDDSLDVGRVMVVEFDGIEDVGRSIKAYSDGTRMLPAFDAEGNVVVIRQRSGPEETYGLHQTEPGLDLAQPARAETYGTFGEAITTIELKGPVLSQRTAGGGRFLLRTFADGSLMGDLGDGNTLEIQGHGYLTAAW